MKDAKEGEFASVGNSIQTAAASAAKLFTARAGDEEGFGSALLPRP